MMDISKQAINEISHDLPSRSHISPHSLSPETIKFLKSLEGECQIKQVQYLQLSYLKLILLTLPIVCSVIGLVLVLRNKLMRVRCFFQKVDDINQCTHVYACNQEGLDEICNIVRVEDEEGEKKFFVFEELRYEIGQDIPLPMGIKLKEKIGNYLDPEHIKLGLSTQNITALAKIYGKNEHLVKIPAYHLYLLQSLTQPLIIIQYITVIIYFFENTVLFAIMLLASSVITIHINYVLLVLSHWKIKGIAEKKIKVKVRRNGQISEIDSAELVPGDLYFPEFEIPCDSVVVSRDIFVSEVGFTGENIPVGKFALSNADNIFKTEHWAYEGCSVVSKKDETVMLAINTGYSSRRGRIIRKILHRKSSSPQFFLSLIWLVLQVLIVNLCIYGICYHYMFDEITYTRLIYFRVVDFIVDSIPAVLQIYINLLHTFSLVRLNANDIIGTEGDKTVSGARIETLCFDKTGTLTQNQVKLESFIKIGKENRQKIQSQDIQQDKNLLRLFASCHSVQEFGGAMHGDEIDVKMFAATKARFAPSQREGVVHEVTGDGFQLEVCKIHQFESRFQSMSVLARDTATKECFIFAKGSPETIHAHAAEKHAGFDALVKELSLEGFRTIAVGMRRIDGEAEFARLAKAEREEFLRGIRLLGLATFTNQLKDDAFELVATLRSADIAVKIITGDNLFVAVQTALALGVVPAGQSVVALEGAKLQSDGSLRAVAVSRDEGGVREEEIVFPNIDDADWEGRAVAMDFDFIKRKEALFLQLDCAIFARATPETKTLIVKKEKEKLKHYIESGSLVQRWFGGRLRKVGMVGDGANDLMAIREADIGIGISNSDAVYSSDFTIKSLSQIDYILRQSKGAERRLIEMTNFNNIIFGLLIPLYILLTHEMSMVSSFCSIYRNFFLVYPTTILIALTSPADKLTPYCPASNMFGFENQLAYWGTIIINSGGLAVSYLYYYGSPNFHHNLNKTQLKFDADATSIIFLSTITISCMLIIGLTQGRPWKLPIWTNKPISIITLVNFVAITFLFLNTQYITFLNLPSLDSTYATRCYLICVATGILSIIYNRLIQSLQLYKTQFSRAKQLQGFKLKQISHSIV